MGVRAGNRNGGRKYLELDERANGGQEENSAFADERGFSASC